MATVRYIVDDVDLAAAFYVEHLGFEVARNMSPAFVLVTFEDLSLWLSGPRSSAARPMPDGRAPEPGGWNRLVLEVDSIDDVVARLRGAGLPFRNEIVTGPGGRQILVEDPSGNPVELFEAA